MFNIDFSATILTTGAYVSLDDADDAGTLILDTLLSANFELALPIPFMANFVVTDGIAIVCWDACS